jgi:hypothetical protein
MCLHNEKVRLVDVTTRMLKITTRRQTRLSSFGCVAGGLARYDQVRCDRKCGQDGVLT